MKLFYQIIIFFLLFETVSAVPVTGAEKWFLYPERISYDDHCLQIEGRDVLVYSGAFHYFRVPQELWLDRFQKMKAAGFNTVETYVPWNYHERQRPASPTDFSKVCLDELQAWLTMACEQGFYVIVRPGPYICAEWDGGGFPQWLVQERPQHVQRVAWLQSDDEQFVRWSKHWYEAVCRVVTPFQLVRRPVGEAGVILFQIENEYNRVNWFPWKMKQAYLADLANFARHFGIEVPLFTCWTSESRNVTGGPLEGVIDFVNSYPRWNVKKSFGHLSDLQLQTQPGKPLMSGELQGGWYSEVGGVLSEEMDGVEAEQWQNLTFYALQRGYSFLNYYMLVGGTNWDDWASRGTTATYDCFAAIREHGGVGEKFRRAFAVGQMLKEHGTALVRSEEVPVNAISTDTLVEVALRKAVDGSRFFFVRTEDRRSVHTGNLRVWEADGTFFSFDYALNPFGSQVYYLPATATDARAGKWYPQLPSLQVRPSVDVATVRFDSVEWKADERPFRWKSLKNGRTLESYGVYNRHPIYYRVPVNGGRTLEVERIGEKVVNGSCADGVLASVDDSLIVPFAESKESVMFSLPVGTEEVCLLFENNGLHHHTNATVEAHWLNGLHCAKLDGRPVAMQFASVEKERGLAYSVPIVHKSADAESWSVLPVGETMVTSSTSMLVWYRVKFELPAMPIGVWYPWTLHVEATGNGFVYLNGRCVGRYWEKGPQSDFFLPECWLHLGDGEANVVVLSLSPLTGDAAMHALSVVPLTQFAEFR